MSVAARLSLFGAALVAVFAVASVAGAALDVGDGAGEEAATHEEDAMAMATRDRARGRRRAQRGADLGAAWAGGRRRRIPPGPRSR